MTARDQGDGMQQWTGQRGWASVVLAAVIACGAAAPGADARGRKARTTAITAPVVTTTAPAAATPTQTASGGPGALLGLITDGSGAPAAASGQACPAAPTTKAFAAWGDTADYTLLTGGGFEAGTSGWQLNTSQAQIVADQDAYNVSGAGSRALELGRPASAASPAFCVDTTNPHFKFMVRTLSTSTLTTIIQYERADGTWANAISTQETRSPSGWQPTDANPLSTSIPGLTEGTTAKVRLWWMNTGGVSRIDSVMVDPYRRR